MSWSLLIAFGAGAALAGGLPPLFSRVRAAVRRYRAATTLEENQVTTIGQVLHLAIQGSPTGLVVIDRRGEVLLSNSRGHEMGLVHDRTLNPELWETAQRVHEDKETHVLNLVTSQRRTGSRVTNVRAVVKPLTLIDDRFVIVYSTDESEYVRMEAARRDFVANVSHELKTPVGGMALLAEALVESADDPEQVDYFGTRLRKEALRMSDLINELISLSKLQGAEALPDVEPVLVDDVITEAMTRNQVAADGHSIPLLRGAPSGVWVNGNKSLLVTAVSNLVSNAINYSGTSAPVSLSQRVVDGAAVQIRVTDRGIGIAPEDQKRVFERFFRVDKARSRSTGGTGLGLAIVKHVVANHSGTIKVWSKPGTGSTFTIELPIYIPEQADVPPVPEDDTAAEPPLLKAVSRVTNRRKDKSS
ncbi:sensor histidine kinase [Corynebacterium oculi]|uniref:Sensor-like histidine kinase SenX3 n=1 Tax=Corynebacterium oculi TaxID=1544416 RepID=A0A0Q0Z4Q2_9CORY|nr:ATP-binding protein [Corynebacterium oculi]KQB84430.1 Signal-transduction histidine kinase senX3 [Corynebacterium oculi]